MIIAIHQPNYLPYLGFFDKMMKADVFVIYDDAQFNKGDFQHRNRIRIYHGWKWLAVPVEKKHICIKDVNIRNDIEISNMEWYNAHFKEIHDNYNKTSYYVEYKEELRKIYNGIYNRLIDLNMKLIRFLMTSFDIDTKLVFSSGYNFKSKSSQKLVDIVDALNGDVYLSGPAGHNYLNMSLFDRKRIKVEFQNFKHPIYRQVYKGFVPNMSAIDALFNVGRMPE